MPRFPKPFKNIGYFVNFMLGESNTEEGKQRRLKEKEKVEEDPKQCVNKGRRAAFQRRQTVASNIFVSTNCMG